MFDYSIYLARFKQGNVEAYIVSFVDKVIEDAIKCESSDIHVEPFEQALRIRFRIDGLLTVVATCPFEAAAPLITRLKILAHLDIAERRKPQDGRFRVNHIDLRVSTCPTLYGEKVVLRLLDVTQQQLSLEEIGLLPKQLEAVYTTLSHPQGMALVTGPTGSGKTVTLYSALQVLNTDSRNLATIEDPVEITVPGINQVNVNPKADLNFAKALKAFLRQDPDIIMVGEIRDLETADIAIKAAQTGHFVLSTLHTNSAIETLTRLRNIGLANYNIASALSLIIAQRLVRKLCSHCKQIDNLSSSCNPIYRANAEGCEHCHKGFKGRMGVFEVLMLDDTLRGLICENASVTTLLNYARDNGFISLTEHGQTLVQRGITSLSELERVLI